MLIKCKRALLLSDVITFAHSYERLAQDLGVDLVIEKTWNTKYRVNEDIVILGTKFIPSLNPDYYSKAVLILKEDEKPFPFVQQGFNRFIFDYKNERELGMALFMNEPVYVSFSSMELKDLVKDFPTHEFTEGDYRFNFLTDIYTYKGKPIYLAKSQKRYLAEWLLGGHKDNKRRMLLCTLRKKFGDNFLADVDRYGQYEGEKNE